MRTEPTPIGQDVEFIVRRTALLKAHADAVLKVRDRAARVQSEMIAHEDRIMVMDGLSPRLAEVAAKTNLAVRLRELDEELASELCRLRRTESARRMEETRELDM